MHSPQQIARYHETGFIVVPGVWSAGEIAALRAATGAQVAASAEVPAHNAIFDFMTRFFDTPAEAVAG